MDSNITLPDDIDNIYINNNDESNILYTINNNIILKSNYEHKSNIINKIESMIVHDYIDDPQKHNSSSCKNINDSSVATSQNSLSSQPAQSPLKISSLNVPTNFFECFDENLSINNAIVCDKVDINASYMFDNEDLRKNDIYPFEDGLYNFNKKKSARSRVGIIALSAVKLLGGSWLESLL